MAHLRMVATLFCDVYCVLLIGFTPFGSKITAAAAYRETEEIQGSCLSKETRIWKKGFILLDSAVLHSAATTMTS